MAPPPDPPVLPALDLDDPEAVEERKRTLRAQTFAYRGEEVGYHVDGGNKPFDNERAVELAIAGRVLAAHPDPGTLVEVGNVLGHYFPTDHAVLDKFEDHPKVTWNEDVLTFRPPFAPELIISVSTLEHVGHVETPRDASGFPRAVAALHSWLAPGGELLFTVPLGYNPSVLELLEDPPDGVEEIAVLRRVSTGNEWAPAALADVREFRYGRPFPCANAVAVVRMRGPQPAASTARAAAADPARPSGSADLRTAYDRRYYGHMAGSDVHARRGPLRELTNIWRAAALVLDPRPAAVTDVGAGRGELARHFVEAGTRVTLLDYAEPAIEIAREYVGESDLATYVVGDAARLADHLPPASQDAVFMTDVVEHLGVDELRVIFGQIRTVLAPGGKLIVHTPEKYYGSVTVQSAVQGVHITLFEIDTLRELLAETFAFADAFTWNGIERFASRGKCIELFGIAGDTPYVRDGHPPGEVHQTSQARLTAADASGWIAQELAGGLSLPPRFVVRLDLGVADGAPETQVQVLLQDADGANVAWTGTTLGALRDSPADLFLASETLNRVAAGSDWSTVSRLAVRARCAEGGPVDLRVSDLRILRA